MTNNENTLIEQEYILKQSRRATMSLVLSVAELARNHHHLKGGAPNLKNNAEDLALASMIDQVEAMFDGVQWHDEASGFDGLLAQAINDYKHVRELKRTKKALFQACQDIRVNDLEKYTDQINSVFNRWGIDNQA